MRVLWAGYLSARHDSWPRPLSADTHPTVTTCKANTGKTPRFLRFIEPCDKLRRWSDGHDALRQRVVASPGPPCASQPGGSGRFAPLPDLCVGIRSERLEFAL